MRLTQHTPTDPICSQYRPPRWWQRRRYDRARGRTCRACTPPGITVRLRIDSESFRRGLRIDGEAFRREIRDGLR